MDKQSPRSRDERLQRFDRLMALIRAYRRTKQENDMMLRVKQETKIDIQGKFFMAEHNRSYKFPFKSVLAVDTPSLLDLQKVVIYNLYQQNTQLHQSYSRQFGMHRKMYQNSHRRSVFTRKLKTQESQPKKLQFLPLREHIKSEKNLKKIQFSGRSPAKLQEINPNNIKIKGSSRQSSLSKMRLKTEDGPQSKLKIYLHLKGVRAARLQHH